MAEESYDYDVALSFAGEDRPYVKEVADALHAMGVRVFYDRFETAELWGKISTRTSTRSTGGARGTA